MKLAHIHKRIEPIWHVQLAIILAIAAQVLLSKEFVVGPRYALAAVEFVLLMAISLPGNSRQRPSHRLLRRLLALVLLSLIAITNIASLVLISDALLNGSATNGHVLIYSALVIYATNVIVFGLFYWELDNRSLEGTIDGERDFLFPQQSSSAEATHQAGWQPTFFDYLYVSVTNATAFSPTDAMPLTYRAKLLMTVQAFTSLATIALVAARAVNILK
ncbi:MAG: hypothetical protein WCJ24_01735 [Candidatus Saccharibacteria bacterium]